MLVKNEAFSEIDLGEMPQKIFGKHGAFIVLGLGTSYLWLSILILIDWKKFPSVIPGPAGGVVLLVFIYWIVASIWMLYEGVKVFWELIPFLVGKWERKRVVYSFVPQTKIPGLQEKIVVQFLKPLTNSLCRGKTPKLEMDIYLKVMGIFVAYLYKQGENSILEKLNKEHFLPPQELADLKILYCNPKLDIPRGLSLSTGKYTRKLYY